MSSASGKSSASAPADPLGRTEGDDRLAACHSDRRASSRQRPRTPRRARGWRRVSELSWPRQPHAGSLRGSTAWARMARLGARLAAVRSPWTALAPDDGVSARATDATDETVSRAAGERARLRRPRAGLRTGRSNPCRTWHSLSFEQQWLPQHFFSIGAARPSRSHLCSAGLKPSAPQHAAPHQTHGAAARAGLRQLSEPRRRGTAVTAWRLPPPDHGMDPCEGIPGFPWCLPRVRAGGRSRPDSIPRPSARWVAVVARLVRATALAVSLLTSRDRSTLCPQVCGQRGGPDAGWTAVRPSGRFVPSVATTRVAARLLLQSSSGHRSTSCSPGQHCLAAALRILLATDVRWAALLLGRAAVAVAARFALDAARLPTLLRGCFGHGLRFPGFPGWQRVRLGQHVPEQQNSSAVLQQSTVLPPLHGCVRMGQQRPRSGSPHVSPRWQHASPHFVTPGRISPLQQLGLTGPRPQTPPPRHRDDSGLHGLQQNISQQPFEPHFPLQHAHALGQHVGKQASVDDVQYFHPSSATRVSHMCVPAPRATRVAPPNQTPTAAAPTTRSARRRGIGFASDRASSSRNAVNPDLRRRFSHHGKPRAAQLGNAGAAHERAVSRRSWERADASGADSRRADVAAAPAVPRIALRVRALAAAAGGAPGTARIPRLLVPADADLFPRAATGAVFVADADGSLISPPSAAEPGHIRGAWSVRAAAGRLRLAADAALLAAADLALGTAIISAAGGAPGTARIPRLLVPADADLFPRAATGAVFVADADGSLISPPSAAEPGHIRGAWSVRAAAGRLRLAADAALLAAADLALGATLAPALRSARKAAAEARVAAQAGGLADAPEARMAARHAAGAELAAVVAGQTARCGASHPDGRDARDVLPALRLAQVLAELLVLLEIVRRARAVARGSGGGCLGKRRRRYDEPAEQAQRPPARHGAGQRPGQLIEERGQLRDLQSMSGSLQAVRRVQAEQLGLLGELAELAAHEEDALDDGQPRDRGERVDRPLEEPPRCEPKADRDEHDAFDARSEADVCA